MKGNNLILFKYQKTFPTSTRHFLVKYKSAREALILAASLKDRLEKEVRTYSADNNLTVQTIDFLYAGPHMRGDIRLFSRSRKREFLHLYLN